jgi:hypothetical protein
MTDHWTIHGTVDAAVVDGDDDAPSVAEPGELLLD